jgi:hypothetical protein
MIIVRLSEIRRVACAIVDVMSGVGLAGHYMACVAARVEQARYTMDGTVLGPQKGVADAAQADAR